jgi:hypothetical protein
MGAEYLRRGARWYHGLDFPNVINATSRVLLAIGCTRFSLSAVEMSKDRTLAETLPKQIKETGRENTVISYLAIRGHVGWLPALKELDWRYMIYEGHQNDQELDVYLQQLNELVPARILARGRVSDANTTPRDSAIIARLD